MTTATTSLPVLVAFIPGPQILPRSRAWRGNNRVVYLVQNPGALGILKEPFDSWDSQLVDLAFHSHPKYKATTTSRLHAAKQKSLLASHLGKMPSATPSERHGLSVRERFSLFTPILIFITM